jgi:hypothetical protein
MEGLWKIQPDSLVAERTTPGRQSFRKAEPEDIELQRTHNLAPRIELLLEPNLSAFCEAVTSLEPTVRADS